jgi:hypothetical protein
VILQTKSKTRRLVHRMSQIHSQRYFVHMFEDEVNIGNLVYLDPPITVNAAILKLLDLCM